MLHASNDGRQAQFELMMQRLAELQARYRGVRGELLAKVWDELMALKPSESSTSMSVTVASSTSSTALPSCRACGRAMKEAGDGSAICQNGHTRLLAAQASHR